MATEQSFALGTVIGAAIAALTILFNDWLKRRSEKKKWIADKMEHAYLECLKLLSESRRAPTPQDDGNKYLQRESYYGMMSTMLHVPAWMAMMKCYSSKESEREIELHRNAISTTLKELKAHELEGKRIRNKNFLNERGISQKIEDALPVVIECFQRELQNVTTVPLRREMGKLIECSQRKLEAVRTGRCFGGITNEGRKGILLNLSEEEHARVKEEAASDGLTPAEFIRDAVRQAFPNVEEK